MKYLMLVCASETERISPEEAEQAPQSGMDWAAEMDKRGIRLQGNQLQAVSAATTVRVRNGEAMVVDGPFAETKEQIAGFDILECADLDEAIAVAAQHPVARFGALELRPFRTD
jgi:hypothetical protein